jgi:hypothetical protein
LGELQISMDKQPIFCDNIYSNISVEDNTYMGALDKVIENF